MGKYDGKRAGHSQGRPYKDHDQMTERSMLGIVVRPVRTMAI
jgi:hypothetical protein